MTKNKATLNINPELHRQLKIEASKQGIRIYELVERILREGLIQVRKKYEK